MYNKAIEVLKKFSDHGYLAYIVGGYPRDFLLGIKTNDIDICTNAKPKEIMEIFDGELVTEEGYGSVRLIYKKALFDVTTFRRDIKYEDNRKPVKIKYISDLKRDLLRRDFTINTMCIDKDGELLDLLGAKVDLGNRLIKTVGNPRYRIKEDILRSLRAIRFASTMDFQIDDKTKAYIKKYGYLLKKLSGSRKKEELNKIFSSKNKEMGRKLIIELELDKYLGLDNLADIVLTDDLIGIWSQLELSQDYPFSKLEKDNIKSIKAMMGSEIDNYLVYKNGLYISTVVGSIKGISYQKINRIYHNLPIYSKGDIQINGMEIARVLKREPGGYLRIILDEVEKLILGGSLVNEKDVLIDYVVEHYKK